MSIFVLEQVLEKGRVIMKKLVILVFICSSSGYGTGLRRFVLDNIAWVEAVSMLLGRLCGRNPVFGSCAGGREAYVTVSKKTLAIFGFKNHFFSEYDFDVLSYSKHKSK